VVGQLVFQENLGAAGISVDARHGQFWQDLLRNQAPKNKQINSEN
jgi:hypothetical protein